MAVPAYVFAVSVCATIVADGGPGWLNVLVILFFWNAMKFAVMGVLGPDFKVRSRLARLRGGQLHR